VEADFLHQVAVEAEVVEALLQAAEAQVADLEAAEEVRGIQGVSFCTQMTQIIMS